MNERPQHKVSLPDFYIGKYPVTNEQYAAFVKATGHQWTRPEQKTRRKKKWLGLGSKDEPYILTPAP